MIASPTTRLPDPFEPPDLSLYANLPKGRLSYSQAMAYMQCPACFEYEYILEKPRKVKGVLVAGRAVHAAWAHARRLAMREELPDLSTPSFLEDCTEVAMLGAAEGMEIGDPFDPDPPKDVIHVWTEKGPWSSPDAMLASIRETVPLSLTSPVIDKSTGQTTQVPMLAMERMVGIAEVEAPVDFGMSYPFPVIGYIDVRLKDRMIKDTKTTSRNVAPDAYTTIQLANYAMPDFDRYGRVIPLGVDQHVKNTTRFLTNYWSLVPSPTQMEHVRQIILDVAEGISAGRFPVRPGYWCRYPESHALPSFISYKEDE